MKNKIIIGVSAVVILIVGFIIGKVYGDKHHNFTTNDGINGITIFENISDEVGYGIELEEGEVPFNIAIYGGKLKMKIAKGEETIYEGEIDKWQDVSVNVPEAGMYQLMISGEKATGIIKYPVSENTISDITEVPDIINE